MQTDKYTKVILTLIAIGIFSLGCGGGASLEEVNELRQEIAALKEAVEQNNVRVRTRRLEIVNGDGKIVIYAGVAITGDGLFTVSNKSGNDVITAGASDDGNGGYLGVWNKTEEEVISLRVDDHGNGEVCAWNHHGKGKGRVWSSQ